MKYYKQSKLLAVVCNIDGTWKHYTKGNKTEKDKYCTISLITRELKRKAKLSRYREQAGGGQRQRVRENTGEEVKSYKLPIIKQVSSEDVMYSLVTIADNTVLCIQGC